MEANVYANISKRLPALLPLFLLVCVAMAGSTHTAKAQHFTIEDFHSNIVVAEGGSIEVSERIEVVFHQPRHGIYREIPWRYVNELGDKIRMPVTVKSVTRPDGIEWTNRVRREGNVINVRIGHPDRYVRGRQIYVIKYVVNNALLYFDDHDELYWNVTGNYWRAKIESASASIRVETDQSVTTPSAACYTGKYGSRESDCEATISGIEARFATNRQLRVGEGLTVAFGWNKGIVSQPSAFQKFFWRLNMRENWVFAVPVAILVFLFFHWYRRGRDPRVREAVVVMYKPPEVDGKPLTAAQTGTLVDEKLDQRDITAALIGLAVKGYIELHETEDEESFLSSSKDYRLVRIKSPDNELTRFEEKLMREIFPGETGEVLVSEMKNKFYKKLPALHSIMFEDLTSMKFFDKNPSKVSGKYAIIGFIVLVVGTLLLYKLSPFAPWKGIVAGIVTGFSIIGFANAMPAKTRLGAIAHYDILGFQEFMNRADKDRIERMGADESLFYKYLPYAIALDVADHWIALFKTMLTESPTWYVGSAGVGAFSAHHFTQSVTEATSHLGSTMFSAPRGSGSSGGGSGGGGFSGGGGGGGGGGSW